MKKYAIILIDIMAGINQKYIYLAWFKLVIPHNKHTAIMKTITTKQLNAVIAVVFLKLKLFFCLLFAVN